MCWRHFCKEIIYSFYFFSFNKDSVLSRLTVFCTQESTLFIIWNYLLQIFLMYLFIWSYSLSTNSRLYALQRILKQGKYKIYNICHKGYIIIFINYDKFTIALTHLHCFSIFSQRTQKESEERFSFPGT